MLKNVHFYTDNFLNISQNDEYFMLNVSVFIRRYHLSSSILISHALKNIAQLSKKIHCPQILK